MSVNCKRRAVLIAAPGESRNEYLGPIQHTLEGLHNYLVSHPGGSWNTDEITILWDDQLLHRNNAQWYDSISTSNCDYLYVHYLGHGFIDAEHKDHLSLSKDKNIPLSILQKPGLRQTIIADTCRSVPILERRGLGDRFLPIWGNYQFNTRSIFDEIVMSTNPGLALVQSTKSGDKSWGDGLGPLFTQSLLHASADYVRNPRQTKYAAIGGIFELAVGDLKNTYGLLQTPTFKPTGDLLYPFTIGNVPFTKEWG